jgi:hypothetical protein
VVQQYGMLIGHVTGLALGVVDVIWFRGDGHPVNRL